MTENSGMLWAELDLGNTLVVCLCLKSHGATSMASTKTFSSLIELVGRKKILKQE